MTTLKLGYRDPLTDAFGAHPLLGAVLDLNDGQSYTLLSPNGVDVGAPPRTLVPAGNIRTQGEVMTRGVYRHNREARVDVLFGPSANYAAMASGIRTLVRWLMAAPNVPFTIQYQPFGASQPSYLDVVGCAHQIPTDEGQWQRLQFEPVEIVFLCRPGMRGDRVTWQNLAPNPGFEQGSGPAVLVFRDNFANVNCYVSQAGAVPTVAASVMTLVSGARVSFGSPNWAALSQWQLRFKWVTGLTARFYLHYTNANNHLKLEVTGTTFALIHTIAGVPTTIQSGVVALSTGNFYWFRVTQFPWPTPSAVAAPPYLTANLFNDAAGALGGAVAGGSVAGPALDGVTAVSGAPQIEAAGASLDLGGAFAGVQMMSLFGPGGWQCIAQAGGANAFSAGSWEQIAANCLSTGPVASTGCLRVDLGPAGTVDLEWRIFTGGSPTGTWAIPVRTPGDSIGVSVYTRSSGLGVNATRRISVREFDASGSLLRTDTGWASPTLTGNTAAWSSTPNLSGVYVTGANCAYLDVSLRVADSNSGQSANGIVWWENLLVWNQSQYGAGMNYCEMRFPQSPATLLLTGVLGDLPAPAHVAVGTFLSSLATGGALSLYVGRRGQFTAGGLFVANTHGFYGTALSPQSTATLDPASYGGYYASLASLGGGGWNPRAFSFKPSDMKGVYHLLSRGRTQQVVGNLPQLTARPATQQLLSPWYGAAGGADQVATYAGPYMQPFTQQNVWTVFDVGQVAVPAFPVGSLTDLAQTYLTPRVQPGDASGAPQAMNVNWAALLPVDGSLLVAVINNPANAPFAVTNQWLWAYFDGLAMAWGGDPGWTYSLEAGAASNPAHGGAGPGSQSSGNININSGADPCLTVDPGLLNSSGSSVQQIVASVSDQAGSVLGIACEVSYSPLYLWPR